MQIETPGHQCLLIQQQLEILLITALFQMPYLDLSHARSKSCDKYDVQSVWSCGCTRRGWVPIWRWVCLAPPCQWYEVDSLQWSTTPPPPEKSVTASYPVQFGEEETDTRSTMMASRLSSRVFLKVGEETISLHPMKFTRKTALGYWHVSWGFLWNTEAEKHYSYGTK